MRMLHLAHMVRVLYCRSEQTAGLFWRQSTQCRMIRVLLGGRRRHVTTCCPYLAGRCNTDLIVRNARISGLGVRPPNLLRTLSCSSIDGDALHFPCWIDSHARTVGEIGRQVLSAAYN